VCANRRHGHAPLSTTTSNARKCCASNPGPTSRLRHSGVESQPASRLLGSQLAPRPPVLLPGTAPPRRPTVVAARLLAPGAFSRRRNVAHSLRSRQNAACDNSAPARKPASATSPTFLASLLSRHPATLLHSHLPLQDALHVALTMLSNLFVLRSTNCRRRVSQGLLRTDRNCSLAGTI